MVSRRSSSDHLATLKAHYVHFQRSTPLKRQVLPNLNFLLSAVRQGAVNGTQLPPGSDCTNGCNHAAIWRDYLMGRITTWTRVISSSSRLKAQRQYDETRDALSR